MKRLLVLAAAALGLLAGGSESALAAPCTVTPLSRDGHFLTAQLVDPGFVTGPVDASRCDIGIYVNAPGTTVSDADIFNATYFGVAVDGASAEVTNSSIHDIGDVPLSGAQHGVGIAYVTNGVIGASGTVDGNSIWNYQKNGMLINGDGTHATVTNNTVTGSGHTDRIAQNGIQVSRGATVDAISGNTVSDNIYTQAPPSSCPRPEGVGSCVGVIATGFLFFQTGAPYKTGDIASANHAFRNQCDFCIIK